VPATLANELGLYKELGKGTRAELLTYYVRGSTNRRSDLLRGHPSEIERVDDLGVGVILGLERLERSMWVQ
jgi:hypothetical protein